jgi:hypothetical protein
LGLTNLITMIRLNEESFWIDNYKIAKMFSAN